MPLIATKGAASVQGFGEFAQSAPAVYIEDVFSTYLYTGNSSTQTITNNIDLSTKGGMVWTKNRNATQGNAVFDTARGNTKYLLTQTTDAQQTSTDDITAFTSTGYTLGNNATTGNTNYSGYTYVSWTFREQPKFFDVVTFTKSSSPQSFSHNLGSTPGCIILKRTDSTGGWLVAHRGYSGGITAGYTTLNTTNAFTSDANSVTAVSSTSFTLGSTVASGDFVAYLFAHDAGGFGLTGSDNVISCGSFTGNTTVNLGYEPQWILLKNSGAVENWYIHDNMRGWPVSGDAQVLYPNLSNAESGTAQIFPNATGFSTSIGGGTYIYIAIRRGPMKTPTSGTSVFSPIVATSGTGTTNFPVDMQILSDKGTTNANLNQQFVDRLRGVSSTTTQQGVYLLSSSNAAESSTYPSSSKQWSNTGFGIPTNYEGASSLYLSFGRAPGFFDVVCYTGTSANATISHNLGVAPELIICKSRSSNPGANWVVWDQTLNSSTGYLYLNSTQAASNFAGVWNGAPTSTYFTLGTNYQNNNSGTTFVAYLFATVAGVSKVGSYTGTGTTLQVNCGFTGGSRFVLIKRTDDTGDWYVWDSARGIVAGNDPYLLLNSTAAEVTNTDYVDTYSAGFEISSTAPAAINANGGTFIFLAIA